MYSALETTYIDGFRLSMLWMQCCCFFKILFLVFDSVFFYLRLDMSCWIFVWIILLFLGIHSFYICLNFSEGDFMLGLNVPTSSNFHVNFIQIHRIKCIDWVFICSTDKWTVLYVMHNVYVYNATSSLAIFPICWIELLCIAHHFVLFVSVLICDKIMAMVSFDSHYKNGFLTEMLAWMEWKPFFHLFF